MFKNFIIGIGKFALVGGFSLLMFSLISGILLLLYKLIICIPSILQTIGFVLLAIGVVILVILTLILIFAIIGGIIRLISKKTFDAMYDVLNNKF